ncbi:hypothetical protein CBS101457_001747 [Exobasidium rhododendri]|nr:hypothetical protein CBS101457_001747 [Exobasidium rhododendri]
MSRSPDWATWSYHNTNLAHEKSPFKGRNVAKAITSSDPAGGGLALFKKSAGDDLDEILWHEYDAVDEIVDLDTGEDDLQASAQKGIDAIDLDELFANQNEVKKVDGNVRQLELLDDGRYRFDPLTPIESSSLQRALKLSKYIAPTVEEKEEEHQRLLAVKVIATKTEKEDPRRKGRRINEETGKRIYNIATGATGITRKENEEARKVLQTMCKSMLPRRHFDWILAQLTYKGCDMLGFSEIPSMRTLIQDQAKECVLKESMPIYHLAYITKLLADASKIKTSELDIVDPTRSARARGEPVVSVRNRMTLQSEAIFKGLQLLFPAAFGLEQDESLARVPLILPCNCSSAMVAKVEDPEKVKGEQFAEGRSGGKLDGGTASSSSKEMLDRSEPPAAPRTILKASREKKKIKKVNMRSTTIATTPAARVVSLRRSEKIAEEESAQLFYQKFKAQVLQRESERMDDLGNRSTTKTDVAERRETSERERDDRSDAAEVTSFLSSSINHEQEKRRATRQDAAGEQEEASNKTCTNDEFKNTNGKRKADLQKLSPKRSRRSVGEDIKLAMPSFWAKKKAT